MTGLATKPNRPRLLTRLEAARLLRAARHAVHTHDERACELIGWAYGAMRESRAVRKLKIDYLLQIGQHDSADALIARTVMQGEDDPRLRYRYAQSLHAQGRLEQAEQAIVRVLKECPRSVRALLLAANIARDRGDTSRAIMYYTFAADLRPHDQVIQRQLVQTFLDSGMTNRAVQTLERMTVRPLLLSARVLWAQRQCGDAMDVLQLTLEQADHERSSPSNTEPLFMQWLEYVDHTLDQPRLSALRSVIATASDRVKMRAAEVAMMFGDWRTVDELASANPHTTTGRTIKVLQTMAAALQQHANQQNDGYMELDDAPRLIAREQSVPEIARLWLRGLLGMLAVSPFNAKRSGADPQRTVLTPLLRRAITVFDEQLDALRLTDSARMTLEAHRRSCQDVLGWRMNDASTPTATPEPEAKPLRRAA